MLCLSLAHNFSLNTMLFFASLLHALWRKESPYRWGKGQQKLERILLEPLATVGMLPHRRWAGRKGIPHRAPTTWARQAEHRDKFKKDPDHKTVSQQGGGQLLRSDLRSGPTTTLQAHTEREQPRSSQEVSPGWEAPPHACHLTGHSLRLSSREQALGAKLK